MATNSSGILCDLGDLLEGKDINPSPPDVGCDAAVGFIPKTKKTVCYIVGAVLISDKGEILMIQEANKSCRGTWYLPLGRLEKGESLQEGAQREVLEESGLRFVPTTLLSVKGAGTWYRFIYTGNITGGKLKTVAEADTESLQAGWFRYDEVMEPSKRTITLRAPDILKVIEVAYSRHLHTEVTERVPDCLGSCNPHQHMLMRLVLLHKDSHGKIKVLVNSKGQDHFPTSVIAPRDFSFDLVLFRILRAAFGKLPDRHKVYGVLNVEYAGKPPRQNDGFCLTLLAEVHYEAEAEVETAGGGFNWRLIPTGNTLQTLCHRIDKGLFIPLFSP